MRKLLVPFVLAISVLSVGCAKLKSDASAGGAAAVACAKQDVTQAVGSGSTEEQLISAVTKILVAGATDWQAELVSLETTVGLDAIQCATRAAVAALTAQMSAQPSDKLAAEHVEPVNAPAIARGQAFLAGVTFR